MGRCEITKATDVCWEEETQICKTKECDDGDCEEEEVCHSEHVERCKRVVGAQRCWFEEQQICKAVGGEQQCSDEAEEKCEDVCHTEGGQDSISLNQKSASEGSYLVA